MLLNYISRSMIAGPKFLSVSRMTNLGCWTSVVNRWYCVEDRLEDGVVDRKIFCWVEVSKS